VLWRHFPKMTQLRARQKEEIIRKTLARISPAAGGTAPSSPGSPPGVATYNGRTGNVTSVIGDIVAHASTHNSLGSDPVQLAESQVTNLSADLTARVLGTDPRLSDARTPTAHASTHKAGGSDSIKLDELAAPTDVTTLNADASKHGLLPKLANTGTQFLRDDGVWINPGASAFSMSTVELNVGAVPITRRSGHLQITGLAGLVAGRPVLVRQAAGPYTGKGTRADEADMDTLSVVGKVLNATTIDIYWRSMSQVHGNFKFDYVAA
jgi:hypothetical protein